MPATLPNVLAKVNGEPVERWELEVALKRTETRNGGPLRPRGPACRAPSRTAAVTASQGLARAIGEGAAALGRGGGVGASCCVMCVSLAAAGGPTAGVACRHDR